MVFALPSANVLVREVTLPFLSDAELRRLMPLDMDRLTPLRNEDVAFDLEPGEAVPGGRRRFAIGIVRRKTLEETLDTFRAMGADEPRAISLVDRESGTPHFDLLKALRDTGKGAVALSAQTCWWIAALVLMVANIGLWAMCDISALQDLQQQVDAQRPMVAVATKLRRRVDTEAAARQLLLQRRADLALLPLLAVVTHALPNGAYAQRFEWNGVNLHLVGRAQPGTDVLASLTASHAFDKVRPTSPEMKLAAGSFDVTITPKQISTMESGGHWSPPTHTAKTSEKPGRDLSPPQPDRSGRKISEPTGIEPKGRNG